MFAEFIRAEGDVLISEFNCSRATGPAQYGDSCEWQFMADVCASIVARVPTSSYCIEVNNFDWLDRFLPMKRSPGADKRFPGGDFFDPYFVRIAWTINRSDEVLSGDNSIILFGQKAIFMPRSREHLEAATFQSAGPVHLIRGLDSVHDEWAMKASSSLVEAYVAQHAFARVEADVDGLDVYVLDGKLHDECRAGLLTAIERWNNETPR